MVRNTFRYAGALLALAVLLSSCGLKRHKYDNPITKDTQQPDKVLFDAAVSDIEHSRYERARLTLQTLMNTYDTSEFLAKSKLAIADSWFREGGAHGFAQAEAEYKDFILFYPTMEEAAEAQQKICKMQFQQMEKADRDPVHALRAEDECRQLLVQFPNSKFAPDVQQMLRNIQEVLADKEFRVGVFYHHKGSMAAASARLQGVTDQFPLFSGADEALWQLADSYHRMGDKFENQEAAQYTRLVKDYPLSTHVAEATAKLEAMKRPVPKADEVAYARMKYELENRQKRSLLSKAWEPFAQHPNVTAAAKSGSPAMEGFRPRTPSSVPQLAGAPTGTTDVSVQTAADPNLINTEKDARGTAAQVSAAEGGTPAVAAAPATPAVAITRDGIDLNTASPAVITKLVGKTLAKRVMAFRPYSSVQDLIKAGVPQKTIDRMKPVAPTASASSKSSTK